MTDRISNIFGELQEETDIVDGQKTLTEQFIRFMQMAQISLGIMGAGIAVALVV